MNAEQLLQHFDRISEAPDAIPRLREFILELAVRGKLVERDHSDEPASEFVKRLLVKSKKRISKPLIEDDPSRPDVEDELFEIPSNWSWVRLGDITEIVMGQSPPGDTYNTTGDGIPLINGPVEFTNGPFGKTVINQYTTAPTKVCEAGDLLLCVRGSTTGRTNVAGFRACIGRGVAAIRPLFDDRYVQLVIWRFRASIIAMGRGIAFPSVSRRQVEELRVPLPPLAEQHRIVAKVDELMALCDRLEAAQTDRERRRDRVVAASLHRLNQRSDEVEAFRVAARFHLCHLSNLSTRIEHVVELRETIRNIAVLGRLLPQNAGDEPASQLLERMAVEKAQLLARRVIPKQKAVHPDRNEVPLVTPPQWERVSFSDVCKLVTSGSRGWAEFYSDAGPKFIRAQNIRFGRLLVDDIASVSPPDRREGSRTQVGKGDLLLVITGAGVTNPALVDIDLGEAYVSQHVALIKPIEASLSPWLLLCLMAPMGARGELVDRAYGAGKPGLNLDNIRSLNVPIPPLAEQHRIVAKVAELMAICDRLEAQLSTAHAERERLLEAVLQEALEGHASAESRSMVAR